VSGRLVHITIRGEYVGLIIIVSVDDLVAWKQLKPRENARQEAEVRIGRLDSGSWPARGERTQDDHVFYSCVLSHHVSVCVCIFSFISARIICV
jgi:hypothetical protein